MIWCVFERNHNGMARNLVLKRKTVHRNKRHGAAVIIHEGDSIGRQLVYPSFLVTGAYGAAVIIHEGDSIGRQVVMMAFLLSGRSS